MPSKKRDEPLSLKRCCNSNPVLVGMRVFCAQMASRSESLGLTKNSFLDIDMFFLKCLDQGGTHSIEADDGN